jgi:hypothetical protein
MHELLAGVDMSQSQHLMRAFDIMAERLSGVSNSTALWALATLTAKILAGCAMDDDIMTATTTRFSSMLKAAYPIMVRALEDAQRQQEGRPKYDA